MVRLPITSPDPLPDTNAVWVAVDSRVRFPLALSVSLLRTTPITFCPDEMMLVWLPASIVRLLNCVDDVPPRVCMAPANMRVPPLWVNEPLLTQLAVTTIFPLLAIKYAPEGMISPCAGAGRMTGKDKRIQYIFLSRVGFIV